MYSPGEQVFQSVQPSASVLLLNRPKLQPLHTRSCVLLPAERTWRPGMHAVKGEQLGAVLLACGVAASARGGARVARLLCRVAAASCMRERRSATKRAEKVPSGHASHVPSARRY